MSAHSLKDELNAKKLANHRWFNLLEEVISFVIYKDKCREIFNFNFPYCFHS